MTKTAYWNHNTAYYPWIAGKVISRQRILDVGCGDGELLRFLNDGKKQLFGIDPTAACIGKASAASHGENISFLQVSFEKYQTDMRFDAVIFVASLHHMDTESALKKAKKLLNPNGRLLIVGLSSPSSLPDFILEALRIIPSRVISYVRKIHPCEDENIPVSFSFEKMGVLRHIFKELLPGARIRYGLHYRYLLEWEKREL